MNAVSRRHFLLGAAGTAAASAVGLDLAWSGGHRSPAAATDLAPSDATVVLCTLYGGNDGLNTVIPYNSSAYQSLRPSLAYQPGDVIPLDGTLALHPSLAGFKKLWDSGQLAIIRGIGYPEPQLSHFRSMDIWQSAVPDTDVSTGWVGRWMDATGADPLRAISVGDLLPMMMTGERALGAAVPVTPMVIPGDSALVKDFATLCTPTGSEPPVLAAIAQSGSDLLRVYATVSAAMGKSDPYDTTTSAVGTFDPTGSSSVGATPAPSTPAAATGAASSLGAQFDVVNKLITAGLPTKVYEVSQQTYDTHADEKANQAKLLAELDAAVTTFVEQMANDPNGRHSVVVMYSEFGRRAQSNASGGTDHGAASIAFIAGPAVKGGYYGEYPDLTKLDENGNLVFNTDFRSVYATLLARVIGEDPKVSLGGSFPLLGFV